MSDNKIIPINQNNTNEEEGGIMDSPIMGTIIEQVKPILQKVAVPMSKPMLKMIKDYLKGTEPKNPTGIKKFLVAQVDDKSDKVIFCVLDKEKTVLQAPKDALVFAKSIDNPTELVEQLMSFLGTNDNNEDEKK